MIALLQRVNQASVTVEQRIVGQIGKGLLILLGVEQQDDQQKTERLVKQVLGYRLFSDEQGKMNLNVSQIDGEILVVPNFTLYANCMHGFRPSFIGALKPQKAIVKFNEFVKWSIFE